MDQNEMSNFDRNNSRIPLHQLFSVFFRFRFSEVLSHSGTHHFQQNQGRFLEIDQSETRIAVVAMFVNGSKRNEQFQ
jgi:hypothetical protein